MNSDGKNNWLQHNLYVMRNFGFKQNGLRIFRVSLNLMDLALEQEKIKLNNKL